MGNSERLVLPVWWCSSHMAEAILGNWTLLSTLISDDPAPQTPCRRLNIITVKIKITLTCQLKPWPESHVSAQGEQTVPSVLVALGLQPQPSWHSGSLSHPKRCERWAYKFHSVHPHHLLFTLILSFFCLAKNYCHSDWQLQSRKNKKQIEKYL